MRHSISARKNILTKTARIPEITLAVCTHTAMLITITVIISNICGVDMKTLLLMMITIRLKLCRIWPQARGARIGGCRLTMKSRICTKIALSLTTMAKISFMRAVRLPDSKSAERAHMRIIIYSFLRLDSSASEIHILDNWAENLRSLRVVHIIGQNSQSATQALSKIRFI